MRILPLGDKNEPDGVAVFFEVDDTTIGQISVDKNYHLDREFVDSCLKQKGRNAHLYLLINSGNTKEIVRNLRRLTNEYETVSWWTVEHRKFFLRRRK